MKSSTYNRDLEDHHNGRNWTNNWENTRGGFNPNIFEGLDQGTIDRLRAIKLGPEGIGYDASEYSDNDHAGFWRDGTSFERDSEDDEILYNHPAAVTLPKNRGNWQDAAYTMGLGTVSNKDDLLKLVDRTEAIQKEHGNFLEDGWQAKDLSFYRDQPQQQFEQTDSTPSDVQPEVVTETQPAVVEKEPVVKEPTEGVDYMSSDMQDAYDRIQNYNSGFSADEWIAETSESDIDKQQLAQRLADTYKFEINKELTAKEEADKVSTAVGNTLGVFSGYFT